jgi:hypothetical protein
LRPTNAELQIQCQPMRALNWPCERQHIGVIETFAFIFFGRRLSHRCDTKNQEIEKKRLPTRRWMAGRREAVSQARGGQST